MYFVKFRLLSSPFIFIQNSIKIFKNYLCKIHPDPGHKHGLVKDHKHTGEAVRQNRCQPHVMCLGGVIYPVDEFVTGAGIVVNLN